MSFDRTWAETFTWHLRQIPYLLMHMRELAENTVSAQDTTAVIVSGSSEKARLPYRVEPADDADQLWAELIVFTQHALEHIGGAAPAPLRKRMWQGQQEPQGLPVCAATEAYSAATEIIRWLTASAQFIERTPQLHDTINHLNTHIRKLRARYPTSQPTFRAYKPRLCHCQTSIGSTQRTIYVTATTGTLTAHCDNCGNTWTR